MAVFGTASEEKLFVYIWEIIGNGKGCRECVLYPTAISSYSVSCTLQPFHRTLCLVPYSHIIVLCVLYPTAISSYSVSCSLHPFRRTLNDECPWKCWVSFEECGCVTSGFNLNFQTVLVFVLLKGTHYSNCTFHSTEYSLQINGFSHFPCYERYLSPTWWCLVSVRDKNKFLLPLIPPSAFLLPPSSPPPPPEG